MAQGNLPALRDRITIQCQTRAMGVVYVLAKMFTVPLLPKTKECRSYYSKSIPYNPPITPL